jgi:transposase
MENIKELIKRAQTINGVTYVYFDKPYWDSAKKQTRHKREYIGKLGTDNEFIPNKKYVLEQENAAVKNQKLIVSERKFFGAIRLLNSIGDKIGLTKDLEVVFGKERSQKIISLAYFLVLEGESSIYRFKKFSKTHDLPYNGAIPSQRITEIFENISEDEKNHFFKCRVKRCMKNEYLAYDTTSIFSYSETIRQVKYGKNKDLENLAQINLAMIFGELSKLPLYYRKMPGNINDVSTLKKILIDIDFLGFGKVKLVLDRGFYSSQNINDLYRNRHKFIIGAKGNPNVIKDYTQDMKETIKHFEHYNVEYDTNCLSKIDKWKYEYIDRKNTTQHKNKCIYIHLYFDSVSAEIEKKAFLKKLNNVGESLKNNADQDLNTNFIKKYFIHNEEANSYSIDTGAVENILSNYGYFTILSNHVSDPVNAIEIYRKKDLIEKAFCNIKNRLDMDRTKVSSEEALEGKIFVQFVALTYLSYIHQVMSDFDLYKNYSMASLLDEIDVIEIFRLDSKKIHYSEITKKQHDIFTFFGVQM